MTGENWGGGRVRRRLVAALVLLALLATVMTWQSSRETSRRVGELLQRTEAGLREALTSTWDSGEGQERYTSSPRPGESHRAWARRHNAFVKELKDGDDDR